MAAPPPASLAEGRWSDHELTAQIQFKVLRGHSNTVSSCHFCFEDTKILCCYDRTVKLWNVEKGFPIQVFEKEHTAPISECNFTPDDRRVVTSSYDNTVKAWDMETGKILRTVEHEGIVTSCNISCDSRYVVSGSDKKENTIYVFDTISATVVTHIQGHHKSTITRCCFDPDNQRVTSASYKTVKLWDMITSSSITINEGHNNAISDCCFTSDGHYLCTASWDKSLKIWDIKTGEFRCHELISLNQGHEGSVSSCLFSQNAIWDTDAGYKKLSLKGHWDWVTAVAISKNKKWILSASKDSTLRLWNIEKMDDIPSVIEIRKARGSKIAQELKVGKIVGTGHMTAWNTVKLWNTKKSKFSLHSRGVIRSIHEDNPLPVALGCGPGSMFAHGSFLPGKAISSLVWCILV
ncbi:LOW QUALITY PROTEIN: WD repeat-containing protein 88 [Cariama cristata]